MTLYELTENVRLSRSNRTAISELAGVAAKGSPLCPEKLIESGTSYCFKPEHLNLGTPEVRFDMWFTRN